MLFIRILEQNSEKILGMCNISIESYFLVFWNQNNLLCVLKKFSVVNRQTTFHVSESWVCEAHLKYWIFEFTLSVYHKTIFQKHKKLFWCQNTKKIAFYWYITHAKNFSEFCSRSRKNEIRKIARKFQPEPTF